MKEYDLSVVLSIACRWHLLTVSFSLFTFYYYLLFFLVYVFFSSVLAVNC